MHDKPWCHAKGYHIGKRVQVGADGRMRLKQPCAKTIEEVEETCHKDHDGCLDRHTAGDEKDRQATRNEIAAGDGVGDMLFEGHFV